jgi:hypothetical protein
MEGQVPPEGQGRSSVDDLIGSTSERVQSVLEAAERAAEGIIRDAEVEAERQIAESQARAEQIVRERSRLATQLSDELLEQAATIKEQSDHLITALQAAIRALEQELAAESPASTEAPEAEVAVEPGDAEGSVESGAEEPGRRGELTAVPAPAPGAAGGDPSSAGAGADAAPRDPAKAARLLATQMAVAGSSREEIESRLREELGIDDPAAILDAVGGSGPGEADRRSD